MEISPSAVLGQIVGGGFWIVVIVVVGLILRRLFRSSPRGRRKSRMARAPSDFPGFDSPVVQDQERLLPSRLPEGILGSWKGQGEAAQVELTFTETEYLLIHDALHGVGSGLYEIVDGSVPAFELRLPQSSPETERLWVRLLPDGRLHVRGEAFEWVLTRAGKDRIRDTLRNVIPGRRF
jgi:hypothetical protein